MPLCVNVGLSRKASKNYQSTGVSINVTAELDPGLLAQPEELQRRIGDLYAQARQALDRQVKTLPQRAAAGAAGRPTPANGAHGPASGDTPARPAGGMTASQRRAIEAIARQLDLDPAAEARRVLGVELDELTIRQPRR